MLYLNKVENKEWVDFFTLWFFIYAISHKKINFINTISNCIKFVLIKKGSEADPEPCQTYKWYKADLFAKFVYGFQLLTILPKVPSFFSYQIFWKQIENANVLFIFNNLLLCWTWCSICQNVWKYNISVDRASSSEMFLEKFTQKIWSRFTGENPCRSVISKKFQSN